MDEAVYRNPFKALGEVPTEEDIENSLFRRVFNVNISSRAEDRRKALATAKVNLLARLYAQRVKKITRIEKEIGEAHAFHVELCDASFQGGYDGLMADLRLIAGSARIVNRLQVKYASMIRRDPAHADRYKTEFLGRAGSVVKRLAPSFSNVNAAYAVLKELPDLNNEEFKVVVAGAPHVGKSSLVSKLTSRKIEIGTYPFTTKKINAGTVDSKGSRVIVFDTPGLLDRPLHERNPIERRAVSALRYLANNVVFLIDPTERAGYSVAYQESILSSVKELIPDTEVLKVYTHADRVSQMPEDEWWVSNVTGYGLDRLKAYIVSKAAAWRKHRMARNISEYVEP